MRGSTFDMVKMFRWARKKCGIEARVAGMKLCRCLSAKLRNFALSPRTMGFIERFLGME